MRKKNRKTAEKIARKLTGVGFVGKTIDSPPAAAALHPSETNF